MDLFLINGHDGVSISDMIDWDIKLSDSGSSEDVGVNNLLGVGYELPPLDNDDEPSSLWPQTYSVNSNSSFELDLLGVEGSAAMMVEPSSIMPFVSRRPLPPAAPVSEGDLTEAQPIKMESLFSLNYNDEERIKMETVDEDDSEGEHSEYLERVKEEECIPIKTEEVAQPQSIMALPVEIINITTEQYVRVVQPAKKIHKRLVVPSSEIEVKTFPKPAYSYSCLIAMALKNSQTGSLPVSEIYSFMSHHFPYFKTAPSGWKNSVRHNLSLNKCFEKIEKPHSNSGSQRKGCLWALNPAKKTKMDDEVAKWSKKDPFAIKSAMIYPENLELLERGELKDEAAFVVGETEDDQEDIKEGDELTIDVEDDRISPIDDDSEDEISRIPPSLQPFEPKFANFTTYTLVESEDVSNIKREIKTEVVDELEFLDVENEVKLENDTQSNGCGADDGTRSFLGLDDSTPIYAVDPADENVLIELPLIKKPRVQANYIYQPVLNMKRHNIGGFRSLKIESP